MHNQATHCLTYVSKAVGDFDLSDLESILTVSRKNNPKLDITGVLVYRDGFFLQVLEGPKENLDTLYGKISADKRHHSAELVFDREISERQFGEWSMAFIEIPPMEGDVHDDFLRLATGSPGQLTSDYPYILKYITLLSDYVAKENPGAGDTLHDAVSESCDSAAAQKQDEQEWAARLELLTNKEREVLEWVIGGRTNRQIAEELKAAEATIKVHRGRIMRKMEVNSLPGLVRLCDRIGVEPRL